MLEVVVWTLGRKRLGFEYWMWIDVSGEMLEASAQVFNIDNGSMSE